jgi:uncharacterized delta-60 repeat protein
MAIQSDGKVVLGGEFTSLNGTARGAIARLNGDGTLDATFGNGLAGVEGLVYSIALQPDGKVLIGGGFFSVNGIARGSIARLNADGTLDTTFLNGLPGVDVSFDRADEVLALAEQSNGKILVGGDFASVNGSPRSGIARLNADGSLDSAFGDGLAGVQGYVNARVRWFCEQGDGKILVGGFFTSIHGAAHGDVARLNADGTLDSTFGDGLSGANGSVRAASLQADGKLVVGGEFTAVNGIAGNGVARLHTSFLPPMLGITLASEMPTLQISGEIGRQYVIEYVSDLPASNQWTALPAFTITNSPQTVVDPTATNAVQRFYRARLGP